MSSLEAYALWAEHYPPWAHNPLMRAEGDAVAPIIASIRATKALDVGTGSGRYVPIIAATGARLVVGVDLSMAMLTWRVRERQHRIAESILAAPLVCGNACGLPFRDEGFDLVNASLMVADIEDLGAWMDEMARVLAPGGHLIYSDLHPAWRRNGWRRTFTIGNGGSIEIPYFPHTMRDHRSGLEKRRFEIAETREASIVPNEAAAETSPRNKPVIVVFHAVKRAAANARRRRPAMSRQG
jgi:malonyl-CoA O-methyltransferase